MERYRVHCYGVAGYHAVESFWETGEAAEAVLAQITAGQRVIARRARSVVIVTGDGDEYTYTVERR